ncbi:UNVERIFIED_ORG: hypothetical protein J2806_003708 [Kosakonia oryzae]|nr:hypothetical protein [Kosakonia radicincitans]MDP9568033.1 hypothetical protein [Kosakonia oryzae]
MLFDAVYPAAVIDPNRVTVNGDRRQGAAASQEWKVAVKLLHASSIGVA